MKTIVIDYGMGNLGSIANMVKKIGGEALITSKISDIESAEKIILPGVGAFDNGMNNLRELGLIGVLNGKALDGKAYILGICLGMQLMTKKSEEGTLPGLGWFDAETIRFNFKDDIRNLKVPHMGWNTVEVKKTSRLFKDMYTEPRFYFVHSYYVKCANENDILTETNYGFNYTSAAERDNIFGVQFHPEKSHKMGMKLLKNFLEI